MKNNTVAEESSDDSLMTDEDIEYERTISPEQKIDHMLSNIHCASPTKLQNSISSQRTLSLEKTVERRVGGAEKVV